MKLLIPITPIVAGLLWMGSVGAQMHHGQQESIPMHSEMMHDHMTGTADLMSEMAAVMRKGDLTPEQQEHCAELMERMSGLMRESAADPDQDKVSQRGAELEQIEKEWDDWTEEQKLYGH